MNRLTPVVVSGLLFASAFLGAQAQVAPADAAASAVSRQGLRIDDRRPDNPFTVDLLGRPVEFTGSWEYSDERRRNFDLQRSRERDRRVREHELKLEARVRPTPDTEVFVEAVGLHETRHTQGSRAQRNGSHERGQSWLRIDRLGGSNWSVQIGRVALIDRRAWWWDDDLDAVRLIGSGDGWRLDTGVAHQVAKVSSDERRVPPEARGVTRWFGQATWELARRHRLDGFWLIERDNSRRPISGSRAAGSDAIDPSDFRGHWIGARSSGEWRPESGPRIGYWADVAWVHGREALTSYAEGDDGRFTAGATRNRRVRGHAYDVGTTVIFPIRLRPSVTLGHARGSGGARNSSRDSNFRQTGLQENKARLAGVKRVQTYGELLQPELSNLGISTLAAGVRLTDDTSLELIAHRYRQPVASSTLPGSRLSVDPQGHSADIGREIDLVLSVRESRRLEFTLKWSHFKPGAAFAPDQRDPARALELGMALNF